MLTVMKKEKGTERSAAFSVSPRVFMLRLDAINDMLQPLESCHSMQIRLAS